MRRTVGDCLPLDANRLAPLFRASARLAKLNLPPLPPTSIEWDDGSVIGLRAIGDKLHLAYLLNWEPKIQTIQVLTANCHFGGHRFYFTCPSCQKRRYKLRAGGHGFICRQCYGLPYYSQQCAEIDGLIYQRDKVEDKLFSPENRGMRISTMEALDDKVHALNLRINEAAAKRFGPNVMSNFDVMGLD